MTKDVIVGELTMSTYDLWKKLNEFRVKSGDNEKRHSDFIIRVEDEIDDLGVCENFVHPQNMKTMKKYTLNKDQILLVGMRESKTVRKQVLVWLNTISKPKTIEEMQAELLIAYQQRELEKTRSIQHGYKSVIGVKNKVIDGVKGITGAKLQRDVVSSVNDMAIRLEESKDFATILAIQKITGADYSWRELKRYCTEVEIDVKDIPDDRWGTVKSYPSNAWYDVYGIILKDIL